MTGTLISVSQVAPSNRNSLIKIAQNSTRWRQEGIKEEIFPSISFFWYFQQVQTIRSYLITVEERKGALMEGKKGKCGARLGRTVRSRFAQTRGKRSEGLLIHSAVNTSSMEGDQEGGELVTYSLGKQNRWLLPEVIKTNAAEFKGDVVLVERYTREGGKKRGRLVSCSEFSSKNSTSNSKNDTIQKPKRKHERAKDFPKDGEKAETKTRYEVEYPLPAGCWSKNVKRSTSHGKRKKYSCTSLMFEDEFDDPIDTGYSEIEDDEELNDHLIDKTSDFDLSLFVNLSSQATSTSQTGKSTQRKESESVLPGKCIYVESESEMHEEHLELLAQIQVGGSLLDAKNQIRNNVPSNSEGKKGHRHRIMQNQNNKSTEESIPPAGTSSLPVDPAQEDADAGIVITLRRQDVEQETLAQQWGEMYKEGASHPRTFLLNLTPLRSIPNSKDFFIAFRVSEDCASEVKALINIVICDDYSNTERITREFVSQIHTKNVEQRLWTLEDIVSVTACCFRRELVESTKGGVDYREPRQPRLTLDVFTNLFGWKSKTYSLQGVQQEIKECVAEVGGVKAASAVTATPRSREQQMECEICFREMEDKDTGVNNCFISMNACGHKFCVDCWRAHLKTQIQLGHTDLRCPGYKCPTVVDDVTLMSLLPSWYGKHVSKRLNTYLEINPEWKWCPTDQCKLVVKATSQGPSVACDENASSVHPVPVVCVCGTMWCFKCQEDAHWPATCKEAQVFRQKNASYARLVARSVKKNALITSVNVKHCPFCFYPVEKGLGCDHMTCILCFKEFCWVCLGKWSSMHSHQHCKMIVNLRKVTLPTKLVPVMSYEHIAVTSQVARMSLLKCKIHKRLDKVAKELKLYSNCFPLKQEPKQASNTEKQLNLLCENNATYRLKEVFNFKFQALLVLEGSAIRLTFSKDTPCSKRLAEKFSRLTFIVQRMDDLLKDLNHCLKDKDSLCKLNQFVKFGIKCIRSIGRHTKQTTLTS